MSDKKERKQQFAAWLSNLGALLKASFTRNFHLKLLSLALAFVVWPIMMLATDPTRNHTVRDVPIKFENADVFAERGFATVENLSEMIRSVNAEVTIRHSDWQNNAQALQLSTEARVDLSRVTETGLQRLPIIATAPITTGANVVKCDPPWIEVNVERLTGKRVPLRIEEIDLPNNYWTIDGPHASAQQITISGAESVISRISTALVQLDYSQLVAQGKEQYMETYFIFFADQDGALVETPNLSVSDEGMATLAGKLRPTKSVPIVINDASFSGQVAEGHVLKLQGTMFEKITELDAGYDSVTIAGSQAALDAVDYIEIEPIDIEGDTNSFLGRAKLIKPAGIDLLEFDEVGISVVITEIEETRTFADVDLQVRNAKEGTVVTGAQDVSINVDITAPLSLFKQFQRDDIAAYIDLAPCSTGVYILVVEVEILDDDTGEPLAGYDAKVDIATVEIDITEQEEP